MRQSTSTEHGGAVDAVELFATPNHAAHQHLAEQFIRDALAKIGDNISQAPQA